MIILEDQDKDGIFIASLMHQLLLGCYKVNMDCFGKDPFGTCQSKDDDIVIDNGGFREVSSERIEDEN